MGLTSNGFVQFSGSSDLTPEGACHLGINLVAGVVFAVCSADGEVAGGHEGIYKYDTRCCSQFRLRINGQRLPNVAVESPTADRALFRLQDTTLGILVEREFSLHHNGASHRLVVRNGTARRASLAIEVCLDADLADIFEVRGMPASEALVVTGELSETSAVWTGTASGAYEVAARCTWRSTWSAARDVKGNSIILSASVAMEPYSTWVGAEIHVGLMDGLDHSLDRQRHTRVTEVPSAAPATTPTIVQRSLQDLAALRIEDDEFGPGGAILGAGVPWFMTLFGRDSVLAAWMAMLSMPDVAYGTARSLARFQGRQKDLRSEEEPGKIPHEIRLGRPDKRWLARPAYYGSIDSTPLFVWLVGELDDSATDRTVVDDLLPAVDMAIDWIRNELAYDGYLAYQSTVTQGHLRNQGWKDSEDGVCFADGRLPLGRIALSEVQGYVYGALCARSRMATRRSDRKLAMELSSQAKALKVRFNHDFWLPDVGWYALALTDEDPVDALASNVGHCLWMGIVDEDRARHVAAQMVSSEMFNGWGIRTLATSMARYDPMGYHCGAVWPHDTALCTAGLVRYGYTGEAEHIGIALLDAAEHFDGRLPELFSGAPRRRTPKSIPQACRPQAWAAATPLLIGRLLGRYSA